MRRPGLSTQVESHVRANLRGQHHVSVRFELTPDCVPGLRTRPKPRVPSRSPTQSLRNRLLRNHRQRWESSYYNRRIARLCVIPLYYFPQMLRLASIKVIDVNLMPTLLARTRWPQIWKRLFPVPTLVSSNDLSDALADAVALGLSECRRNRQEQLGYAVAGDVAAEIE